MPVLFVFRFATSPFSAVFTFFDIAPPLLMGGWRR
jgi:hypothetical protein